MTVTSGASRSMLMPLIVLVLVRPALSTDVPTTLWFAPLVASVFGASHEATPDVASVQVNVAVTAVLFQPRGLAAGVRVPEIAGAVLSILMLLVVVLLVLPAASFVTPVRPMFVPSVE